MTAPHARKGRRILTREPDINWVNTYLIFSNLYSELNKYLIRTKPRFISLYLETKDQLADKSHIT